MNLVDTSGWIEYFFDERNSSYFAEPIENTSILIVPVVCLYEVFKKVNQVADEAQALQAIAQMKQGKVIELSEEIALKAAMISLRHNLPIADSFIYATGQLEKATIWTQDVDFKEFPGVKYKEARTSQSTGRSKSRAGDQIVQVSLRQGHEGYLQEGCGLFCDSEGHAIPVV